MIDFSRSIEEFRSHVPATAEASYLLTASTGLIPDFVYQGVRRYMDDRYLRGGDSRWEYPDGDVGTLEMLDRSKSALGKMLGCDASHLTFGQSATQMFTMVTEGIDYPSEANVVTVGEGWIGNRFAWQKREANGLEVRYAKSENGLITAESLMALCDQRTAAITVNLVESDTGYRADIEKLGRFCRERGILLFVDATQAAGALKIDLSKTPIDFLVGNDYKWMMNFCGTGYAYLSDRVASLVSHWGAGWMSDTERFNTSKKHLTLREDAGRFEIGYPHADGIYGLGLVASQYALLGAEAIENYVCELASYCRECAARMPGVNICYDIPKDRESQILVLSFDDRFKITDDDFKKAKVVVPSLGVKDPSGNYRMRLSFHYYSNRSDVDRFFEVLELSKGMV